MSLLLRSLILIPFLTAASFAQDDLPESNDVETTLLIPESIAPKAGEQVVNRSSAKPADAIEATKPLRLGDGQAAFVFAIRENNAFVVEFGTVTKFSTMQSGKIKLAIANLAAVGKDPGRAIPPTKGPVFDETGIWVSNRILPRDVQVVIHEGIVFLERDKLGSVRVGEVPQFKGVKTGDLQVGREIKNKKVLEDLLGCVAAYLERLDAGLPDTTLKESLPLESQKLSESQKAVLFTSPRNGRCSIELGEVSVDRGKEALASKFFEHDPYGPWKNAQVVSPIATDVWVQNSILGGDLKLVLENGKVTLLKLTFMQGHMPPNEKEIASCVIEELEEVSKSAKFGDILSRDSTEKTFQMVMAARIAELASVSSAISEDADKSAVK